MRLLDELFRSEAVEKVLSDESLIQRMLEFEAALAEAEAELGIIPSGAAKQIRACCDISAIDLNAIRAGARKSGNLAIPFVKQFTNAVKAKDPEAAKFVHWGATSQDTIDTAVVLQSRDALRLIAADVDKSCVALRSLTERHRNAVMVGRTWLQHALPITFGLKTAHMLVSLHGHSLRLHEELDSISTLQFGGAAGTLAALGNDGPRLAETLARKLKLENPATPWHTDRERIAELATSLGILCGTLGKIARDISLMTQTEIAEVLERREEGRGGSSTMPQKNNPVLCASILANVTRVPGLVSTTLASMVQEHERALGGWQAEWETIPEIISLAGGAVERAAELLERLEVYPDKMKANLEISRGLVFSEAVSFALANKIGKSAAHEILERAAKQAMSEQRHLRDVLNDSKEVKQHLSADEINGFFDPSKYLGATQEFIDRVLAETSARIGVTSAAR